MVLYYRVQHVESEELSQLGTLSGGPIPMAQKMDELYDLSLAHLDYDPAVSTELTFTLRSATLLNFETAFCGS